MSVYLTSDVASWCSPYRSMSTRRTPERTRIGTGRHSVVHMLLLLHRRELAAAGPDGGGGGGACGLVVVVVVPGGGTIFLLENKIKERRQILGNFFLFFFLSLDREKKNKKNKKNIAFPRYRLVSKLFALWQNEHRDQTPGWCFARVSLTNTGAAGVKLSSTRGSYGA